MAHCHYTILYHCPNLIPLLLLELERKRTATEVFRYALGLLPDTVHLATVLVFEAERSCFLENQNLQ